MITTHVEDLAPAELLAKGLEIEPENKTHIVLRKLSIHKQLRMTPLIYSTERLGSGGSS